MVPPTVQPPRALLMPEPTEPANRPRRPAPPALHVAEHEPSWPGSPDPLQRATFEGIDFLTRVRLSAALRGPDFLATIRALGFEPEHFDAHTSTLLDNRMAERFSSAAREGHMPVSAQLANDWLHDELLLLTH